MKRLALILALLAAPALADNTGLILDQPTKVPMLVDGKATHGLLVISAGDGKSFPARLYFARADGTPDWMPYTLTRGVQPGPTPNPQPNPQPNPNPQPPAKPIAIFIIHESADNTPAMVAVRDSGIWRDVLVPAKVEWKIYDKDESKKAFPNITEKAVAAGLPALVRMDAQRVAIAEKLPATPAAMAARCKELVGGGK